MRPSTTSQNVSAPAFDVLTLVHPNVNVRIVYGSLLLVAKKGCDAWIVVEVETGPGTDDYVVVLRERAGPAAGQDDVGSFAFGVAGGRRYRFRRSGSEGVTESLEPYSYIEL